MKPLSRLSALIRFFRMKSMAPFEAILNNQVENANCGLYCFNRRKALPKVSIMRSSASSWLLTIFSSM